MGTLKQEEEAKVSDLCHENISVNRGENPSWLKIMYADGIQVGSTLLTHKKMSLKWE